MAVMNQSIHSITHILDRAPCETSLRYQLKKLDLGELERKNTAIRTSLRHHVLKPGNPYLFAIDYTNNPYRGTTSGENEPDVIRSKRKKSTNEFYSYVTLYMTAKDRQVTLAVYLVCQGVSKVRYIARCLDRITELGLRIEVLCLDREFSTWTVFGFLTPLQVPFTIPVRKHGKQMKELFRGPQSRYTEYQTKGNPPIPLTIAEEREESGDPVSLCHCFPPPEERLDRSIVDAFLAGEVGAENHRYARVPIQVLPAHVQGSVLGIERG
jgi:putative transposase